MVKELSDVTVIIKTFERPESLRNLLISIRQFYPHIHIKIADDSKKPSVSEMTSLFSNIEYIVLPFDVGLSAGRNALLSKVSTKYFVLCDDDFLFTKQTKLEIFKGILEEADVELIAGCVMDRTESGEFDRPNLYAGFLVLDAHGNLRLETSQPRSPYVKCDIVANWFMANTDSILAKTGGWDARLKIEEHTDFFWRAKKAGLVVASTPDVIVNHTLAKSPRYQTFRRDRNDKYYRLYFKKLGIKSFTDRWETVTWADVQPWWIKKLKALRSLNFKKFTSWTYHFIFTQKCIPWSIREKCKRLIGK